MHTVSTHGHVHMGMGVCSCMNLGGWSGPQRFVVVSFQMISIRLKVGLDNGEEVHWSRILGEWSNMGGYKMGSSPAGVYTTAKSSLVKNFKDGWKNDMASHTGTSLSYSLCINMRHRFFLGDIYLIFFSNIFFWSASTLPYCLKSFVCLNLIFLFKLKLVLVFKKTFFCYLKSSYAWCVWILV